MKRSSNGSEQGPHEETRENSGAKKRGELDAATPMLESLDANELKQVAVTRGLQALWQAVLPLVGILPAKPGEFPGVFQVEAGPGRDEATVYLDIPTTGYEDGKTPKMERVVALNIRLTHDYRLLGDQYFCVDCEPAHDETRH